MNEIIQAIIHDGGFLSRKLLFSVFAVVVILAGWLVAGHLVTLQPMYETFVGGVVGISGIYLTGSVATNWVGAKALKVAADQPKKDAAEE